MTQELFNIIKASLWGGPIPPITVELRQELQAQAVESLTGTGTLKYSQAAHFVWMVKAQDEAIHLIQEAGISVVVIKGTASGIYYPQPYLRTYGDIDLLVQPKNYQNAIDVLRDHGWRQGEEIGHYHTALYKDSFILELHQSPPDLDDVKEGKFILEYLLSGFGEIQQGKIDQPVCIFPMLPWQQNGLELIWHFREHLYNGIGLRHAIDWMMFVHHCLDDQAFQEYKTVLEKSGLLVLAKTVTHMCQIYLGLEETITWCADVPESLCADLMEFILDQGNFGHKRMDDKAAKVLTRYHTPIAFLRQMQKKGLAEWAPAKKHPILRPFAWAYLGVRGMKYILTPRSWARLAANRAENRQRREMFDQLYGNELTSSEISLPHTSIPQPAVKAEKPAKMPFKYRLRKAYEAVRRSPLRAPLYHLQNAYFACRYPLFGKPHISEADRANVEQNVTFIFKSFNRQKRAAKLYRCIKAYYPKARVIIADDSKEPLEIRNMAANDAIIHLPFNSGLSKGLIAALEQVKTPFTMRMDDDELLIPASRIHDQLYFLQKHCEVDLAGIQAKHRHPGRGAEVYSRIHMSKRLIIPAGTMIDGREVVYKTANVFVARTDSLRAVGYDPHIQLIDHHEFFFRAAGQIVCVQDRTASIFHCHNYFAKKDEEAYRSKLSADSQYIAGKHGAGYR